MVKQLFIFGLLNDEAEVTVALQNGANYLHGTFVCVVNSTVSALQIV
jgi:hypothetical protein